MGFSGLAGKKPYGTGSYINEEVEVVVEIVANKAKQSENNAGKFFFITEFKVVEVLSGNIQVGVARTQTIDINKRGGPEDCVAFLAAAAGVDPYNTDDFESAVLAAFEEAFGVKDLSMEMVADMVCDDNQPLEGFKLRLQTVNKPIKAAPEKLFTKHMWHPIDSEFPAPPL